MTSRRVRLAAIAVFLFACGTLRFSAHAWAAAPAAAQTPRFAAHASYDRVVFALPPGETYSAVRTGDTLVVQLPGAGGIAALASGGARLRGVSGGDEQAVLRLAPGAHLRFVRLADRLAIDVSDPPARSGAKIPAAPVAATVTPTPSRPQAQAAPPPRAAPEPSPVAQTPPPNSPPARASPPFTAPSPPTSAASTGGETRGAAPAGAVTLLEPGPDLPGPGVFIPTGKGVGAAAFLRAGAAHVVFDSGLALDLGALKDDPVFGGLSAQLLPAGMHLHVRLAEGAQPQLLRRPGGWVLTVVHAALFPAAISAHADHGSLIFAADSPGGVVVLDDEATGGKLLVGTQRAPGQAMPAAHRSAEYAMLPTLQGLVVEPVADRLVLRPVREGFVLRAADGPALALAWADAADDAASLGRGMTRRFDFPPLPPEQLRNRLGQTLRDAALTPLLLRFPARLRVAAAMLSQGLDVEAKAVLHAAAADDPARQDDPDAAGLAAIATWLNGAAGGTLGVVPPGFDPAMLGGTDEALFWQALLRAGQEDVSAPATQLAATWPILGQYPAPLRHRLLRPVGEILARGGQDRALTALLAAFPDPSLDRVRAGQLARGGKIDEALALLDRIAHGRDRLMRAQARRDAVEARLAAHRLTPAQAAVELGHVLYEWRGGTRDLSLRLRLAGLRAQAGQWRQALALLRETDGQFPEAHDRIRDIEAKQVSDLLRGETAASLSALDLVSLAEEAQPLLSAADSDSSLAPVLVEKLLALDLPARAEPLLRRLFQHTQAASPKAGLGVRLAGLMADRGDFAGAADVLDASADGDLDSALVASRGLLRARLLAASGRTNDALSILANVQTEAAIDLQAKILEDRHDWGAAGRLLEATLGSPAFGARPERAQRDLILRLANDASQAGDMAALRRLRESQGKRFASGAGAELFAVLTQEPVQAVSDLPRAGAELEAVKALPASLATTK